VTLITVVVRNFRIPVLISVVDIAQGEALGLLLVRC
jgi:hypothetical protein